MTRVLESHFFTGQSLARLLATQFEPNESPNVPRRCVVVEDSGIGLKAAKAAGMTCVVTKSSYTGGEDFAAADAVFDCIGDAGSERFSLKDLVKLSVERRALKQQQQ